MCGNAPVPLCPTVEAHLRQFLALFVLPLILVSGALSRTVHGDGCTHDLKFYGLAIKLDGPDLEVHADCGDVALGVGIIRETEQKA